MIKFIHNKKAQAMTEFVIILPVMLFLFTGIFQFALISIDKIKLAMVEREIMMFLTEEENKDEKWKLFGSEAAEKLGLDSSRLTVTADDNEKSGEMRDNSSKLGVLSAFTGVEITVIYEHELIPVFKAMTGKDTVRLKTKLISASGGCMKVELKKGIGEAFGRAPGSSRSPDDFKEKYSEEQKQKQMGKQGKR